MTKKAYIFTGILLVTLGAAFSSKVLPHATDTDEPGVYHVILCWLKDPGNDSNREKLIRQTRQLESIPDVISIKVGEMLPSQRPIVDNTYDIGIIMSFKDQKAMNRFLDNPIHQEASQKVLIPLTSKVIVYDFEVPEL